MTLPRNSYKPLAIDAPEPFREPPVRLERMIHFVPPNVEKIRVRAQELVRDVDVLLGNLEDGVPLESKVAARHGFIEMARSVEFGSTGLWVRINALPTPWAFDEIVEIVGEVGEQLDVIMLPKVDGPWDIHYLDRLLAQLEAKYGLPHPILIHCILETAEGVTNVEAIASASPRLHGMSLGPADLAASRAMKTTRVGGGHPEYKVIADPGSEKRPSFQQDLWHYSLGRMVDACVANGIKPFGVSSAIFPTLRVARRSSDRHLSRDASAPGRFTPIRSRSQSACSAPTRPKSRSPSVSWRPCRTAPARS